MLTTSKSWRALSRQRTNTTDVRNLKWQWPWRLCGHCEQSRSAWRNLNSLKGPAASTGPGKFSTHYNALLLLLCSLFSSSSLCTIVLESWLPLAYDQGHMHCHNIALSINAEAFLICESSIFWISASLRNIQSQKHCRLAFTIAQSIVNSGAALCYSFIIFVQLE